MPRQYNAQKPIAPLQLVGHPKPAPTQAIELRPWADGKRLHSLKDSSEILTNELGEGYSVTQLRRRIKEGLLGDAGPIWMNDGQYKINVHAFIEWRMANPDEKALRTRLNRA